MTRGLSLYTDSAAACKGEKAIAEALSAAAGVEVNDCTAATD